MLKKVFCFSALVLTVQLVFGQSLKSHWVDSVFNTMDVNAKVGQLFMISVTGDIDATGIHEIENRIKSHEVGGLIFKKVAPAKQVALVNHFQSLSDIPLLIAQEAELSTLLDSTIVFPPAVVLGAVQNDTLLYRLGAMMANHLKLIGTNLVFKPDTKRTARTAGFAANLESFGASNDLIAKKSMAIMRGLQDNGVISCARYYPLRPLPLRDGTTIPVLQPANVPDSLQTIPRTLIANGLQGVTPGTESFPVRYPEEASLKKTSYSSEVLTALYSGEWLRENFDFHGLTFIDINTIESASDKNGDAELFAFQTGNDVLMNPVGISAAMRKIKRIIKKDGDYERQLDLTTKKILEAKFESGLWQKQVLSADNLNRKLNNPKAVALNKKLYQSAVTVLRNEDKVLPIHILEGRNFVYLAGSGDKDFALYQQLKKYVNISFLSVDEYQDEEKLLGALKDANVVFTGIFPETTGEKINQLNGAISKLPNQPQVIYCDFGHNSFLASAHRYATVVTTYTPVEEALQAASQVIFGGLSARGRLPFKASEALDVGAGVRTPSLSRLTYSVPEDAGMDSRILTQIDSIAAEAIRMGATPGCQVFVARNGKVIYEKAFGHLTYEKTMPVTTETIYDLASITKVAATLQTAMFMHERGLIDLNKKVSHYLPELRKTNKKDITFVDMLTHQSGLLPFLPFYPQTMKDTLYLPEYYSRLKSEKYPLQVSANLYGSLALRDSLWSWVVNSKMSNKPARTPYSYKYSDFGFLILQRVAETLLNQPLDEFMHQNYYEPLGATTLRFTPLNFFQKTAIAPTEYDKIYRRSFVAGTVHDERAAMMGGVAGHAGLFGNASDLGKLGQMLLQEGYYGATQYYKPETVRLFTARKFATSRRGLGWDKPLQSDPNGPTSMYASPETFGHTGFTGTCIWVDPRFNLVYVFLSNRVYPDRNSKLINANIRSRIQDVIYKSIFGYVDQEEPSYIASDFAINAGPVRPLK